MKKLPKSAPISLGHWGTTPGLKRLFTQFSFPGGIPSHVAVETRGSINEEKYTAARVNQ